nr:hypothetical protein [Bacteroidota bacterium]
MITRHNVTKKHRIIGLAGAIATLMIFFVFNLFIEFIVKFGEDKLSVDHQFNPLTVILIKLFFAFILLFLLVYCLLMATGRANQLIRNLTRKTYRMLNAIIAVDQIKQFFLSDRIESKIKVNG